MITGSDIPRCHCGDARLRLDRRYKVYRCAGCDCQRATMERAYVNQPKDLAPDPWRRGVVPS